VEIAADAESVTRNIEKVKLTGVYAGMAAPDFTAAALNGDKATIKLSDFKGKVVLVDFWATWCGPCIQSMPDVNKVYASKKDDGFIVLMVSVDESADKVKEFLKKKGKDVPGIVLHAEGAMKGDLARLYNIEAVPTNFLIGPDGKVLANDVQADKLRRVVDRELKKTKPAEEATASAAQ
jgi:thiol-disulfide isomerase/thioredoxin